MKIVICGSMSASREMLDIENKLVELGHEVVLPDFTHKYAAMESLDDVHIESTKNKVEHDLIRGYYKKIEESDAVLIANIKKRDTDCYIGGNAFLEMGFAHVLNKPVYLLNGIPEMDYKDEIEAMEPIVLDGELGRI